MRRPQPLGVLALPAGWLILPEVDGADADGVEVVTGHLLQGQLPPSWPKALDGVRLAHEGRIAEAATHFDPIVDAVQAYNHFVLTGEESSLAAARSGAAGQGDGDSAVELSAVIEVAAYSLGHPAKLNDAQAVADSLTGEVAAHVLAALASARLEQGDAQGALDLLVTAEERAREVSPVLGALLLGQQAGLLHQVNGADADLLAAYTEAVDTLRGLDAVEPTMAELVLAQATVHHELAANAPGGAQGEGRAHLLNATRAYHLALRLLRKEAAPQRYAFAHSNLALAYLALPMSDARDKLRRGVAVQSLREALTFYTREEYPLEWAAVTLNLANALQHLPTTHPVENLVEAVGMYDEVLTVRTAQADPLGHARVLANQGTALSHLGIHDQAQLKLQAARDIFAAHEEHDSVVTVDEALADSVAVGSR